MGKAMTDRGADLPQPPVPIDADLRHFPNMPLEAARLRDSDIASVANPEVFRCAVMLWCAAWHQVPAGSLPADDATLARMAGLGRDLRTWKRLRADVLRGFHQFSDGRLYHRVICEKVIEGLNSTAVHAWNKACARVRKENHQRAKQTAKLPKLPNPDRPTPLVLQWPDSSGTRTGPPGARTEHEYDSEWKGRDNLPRGPLIAHPPRTVPETSPPIAAREGHEGPTRDAVVSLLANARQAVKAS
jgi:hypothetical protein